MSKDSPEATLANTVTPTATDKPKLAAPSKVGEIFQSLDYGTAPESPAHAYKWLESHKKRFGHFIGGEFTRPATTFSTFNPATGEELAQISPGTAEDVDKAVKSARAAFTPWSALSGFERAKYLYAIARQLQKESRLFAVLETLDNGKPIRESRDIDIPLAARHFYHHAGWAQHIERSLPNHAPYGVCGQIIPWNFPLLMLSWKIAPALAAGNTVVLKPAEDTSLTALLFAQICQRIGLPKGVVNIVTGTGETGAAITAHPDIDKLAFTGSTEVGKIIRETTAGSGKAISLELGGKSPFIVFEDADLDSAVEGIVDAIWFNQGQVCCAGSRLLVQESIATRFIDKIKHRMKTLRVGDPLDKSIDIGAIISPTQLARIKSLLNAGRAEGGNYHTATDDLPTTGNFIAPTLVTDISSAHSLMTEEIFGPVLVAMTFRTPDEAIQLANNTRYGLAASVWSENINVALDIAPQLKAGVVWINTTNQLDAAVGFGGYRESGFGREGGREGMQSYLKPDFEKKLKPAPALKLPLPNPATIRSSLDRTAKLYIAGKQTRPDSGYSLPVLAADGSNLGEVGEGSRKDIRNAVEAARAASGWGTQTAHLRSQILYYLGENLDYRKAEFAERIRITTGVAAQDAKREVDISVQRLFAFAGWADKFDGAVHNPPARMMAIALNEPVGVIGIAAPDEAPLLGAISLLAPAVAMGNTTVLLPSQAYPLLMTDFYQVIETSDVPSGVINIVTGNKLELSRSLAQHMGVDAMLFAGNIEDCTVIEKASACNLKQTWTTRGLGFDWTDDTHLEGDYFLTRTTQVKNIWVPYGA